MSSIGTSKRAKDASWHITNLHGQVVWEGRESPSVRKVQEFLDADLSSGVLSTSSQIALTSYAIQAILNCPVKALSGVLNSLACAFFRNDQGVIDTKKLFAIKLANKRSMCGRPIKKGDILWVCKQCGQDNTCVQCDECFQLSDHTDHEVYFHRSSEGGGCCDCGDTEAWLDSGTCSRHGLDPHAQGVDPLSVLPASLVLGLSAVLQGALLVLLHVTIATVDGFNCPENNPFSRSTSLSEELVVRVHNDDIHSYLEVTSGLQQCGFTGKVARQLTEAVDKDGSADICHTTSLSKVQSCWEALGKNPLGLCVSILPSRLAEVEAALPVLLGSWMQHLAASNDGLMRMVCNALMMPTADLLLAARGTVFPSRAGSGSGSGSSLEVDLTSLFLPAPAPASVLTPAAQTSPDRPGQKQKPELRLQAFPAHLPLRGNLPSSSLAAPGSAPHVLLSPGVDGVAPAPPSSSSSSSSDDPLVTPITRVDPFNSCDADEVPATPRILFAVLIAASPYMHKAMKKCLNSVVIFLQQDMVFKLGYSQLLVHLYPTLLGLFSHGIGTNSDSIFGTSVQVKPTCLPPCCSSVVLCLCIVCLSL
jgi:hypothetical protein